MQELLNNYEYYREMKATILDQTFHYVAKPGVFSWERLDPATELLIQAMHINPTDTVLDLGCGTGLVGLVAAQKATQGQVYLVDNNVVALEASRRTLALNHIGNAEVRVSDCASAVRDVAFDVLLTHLPRGRETAHQFIADAAAVLKPGGRLYLAGHNAAGIKPFIAYAKEILGNAETLTYKKGCRVALCNKNERTTIPQTDYYRWREFDAQVGEQTYRFVSKPGVFSWDRLDAGTRTLLETIKIRPNDTVLDIGCGYGIIGTIAAQKARQVYMVDSDSIAVEAARRTLALNRITHAHVLVSDGTEAVRDVCFDLVISNPPFHQGRQTDYNVAHQFIREAAAILNPRGRLYLVANRFIRYEHQMEACFNDVQIAHEDNLFRVLLAQRPKKR